MKPRDIQINQYVRVSSGPIVGTHPPVIIRRGGQCGRVVQVWRRDRQARVRIPGVGVFIVNTNRLSAEEDT